MTHTLSEKQLFPLTAEELYDALHNERAKIYCETVEERNNVLRALLDCDYEINAASLDYLEPDVDNFMFPHPGFGGGDDVIACYRTIYSTNKWVSACDVINILRGVPKELYVQSEDEFEAAIAELLGI